MITPKAKELRDAAIRYIDTTPYNPVEGVRLANMFWKELFEKCDPTEAEFVRLISTMLVTSYSMYHIWKGK